MRRKVSVIGAGRVGSTTAHLIALKGLADVVVINRTEGVAQGIALDLSEALPIEGIDARVVGSGDYTSIEGSDIVIVTAGAQRKEGMSRDDLLKTNAAIVSAAATEIKLHAPDSIVIIITNPLDAMAYVMKSVTGFDRSRIIGMAGALDSSRFASFIAKELGVSVKEVETMVLGSHGDSMVALTSATTVGGVPITQLVPADRLAGIIARTRDAGAEIIKLEQSSAFYAPASSVVSIVDAVLNDRKRIIPCSAYLEGEYGIKDIFIGVPVVLGSKGIEKVLEFKLSPEEKAALAQSARSIADSVSQLGQ